MKYHLLILYLLLYQLHLSAQTHCMAEERRQLLQQDEVTKIKEQLASFPLDNRMVVTIPVVVHLLWNTDAENLTDEQILSQIDVLNEDFRALNEETSTVPSNFSGVLADVEIEFCLAKVDPNGNPTEGINRRFTNQPVFSSFQNRIFYNDEGGADAWNSEEYMNIWVCDLGGNIAGFASFPGASIPEEDGVVVHYENFGRVSVEPPYHLGRTTTHEVGHYLNLEHVWNACGEDDGIADTPKSSISYLNECPASGQITCGTEDMFMNFMYYTDDACMAMFTEGQKLRMLSALNGPRSSLLTSQTCSPVSTTEASFDRHFLLYPNPTQTQLHIKHLQQQQQNLKIQIFSSTGKLMSLLKEGAVIDVSDWTTGVYYLRAIIDGVVFTKKIIKV